MKDMNAVTKVSLLLLMVGGLNWGLVGFFDYNLVDTVLGAGSTAAMVVYDIVGLAAVYTVFDMVRMMSAKAE
jgi:uncharacterized membrane protein YuzA (DUF378 family)